MERIAVGTDGSDTAAIAVGVALDMAERFGAHLIVASSFVPVSESRLSKEQAEAPIEVQWSINPQEDVDAALREVEELAEARGIKVTSEARQGDPADVLCEIAEDHNADVLVIGNKNIQRRVLGSIPKTIAQNAPCSVLIVKTT